MRKEKKEKKNLENSRDAAGKQSASRVRVVHSPTYLYPSHSIRIYLRCKETKQKKIKENLARHHHAVHSPARRSAPRIEGINSPDFLRRVGCVPHISKHVSTGGDTIQWERDLVNAGEFLLHVSRQVLIKVSCGPIRHMGGHEVVGDLQWEWCLWVRGWGRVMVCEVIG